MRSELLEADLTPQPQDKEKLDAGSYRRQLLEAMANLPSIKSAAFSNLSVPNGDSGWKETISAVTDPNPAGNSTATLAAVSPGFFKTLAIPLMSGRDFTWFDDKQHPTVVIIDSLVAKQLFPTSDPIGKHIRFGVQPDFQDLEIVGLLKARGFWTFATAMRLSFIRQPFNSATLPVEERFCCVALPQPESTRPLSMRYGP